ncbi:helix-turn-helix transcriptional regulator [Wukongibacter sp. M2B1]|uniref:helix-turn-helix transcriptional regulator n=1 Tax=Wukongibacter sp. M2B1 TaxID=3088895 RepID=UPI003D7A37A3
MRKKLKKQRLKKELTQMEIASLIGIKRATYTNIELGNKNPSFNVATKIKGVLGYQDDDIFLDVTCRKDTEKTST